MSDASDSPPGPATPVRKLGARTYLVGALVLFVIPGIVGGAVWWLNAKKAEAEAAFEKPRRECEGHTGGVWAVAISPDGRRGVSGGDDGEVRAWEMKSGKELMKLTGHVGEVHSITFSPDGKRVVSGGWDETVRVWDLESGKELMKLTGDTVSSVAISPDGKWVVSRGHDKIVRVWDLESGKDLMKLTGHTSWVHSVAISPDGKRVVSGSDDGTIRLWDLESSRLIRAYRLPERESTTSRDVYSLAFSPDGRRILSGGGWRDKSIQWHPELLLWRVPTERELKIWRFMGGKLPEPPKP